MCRQRARQRTVEAAIIIVGMLALIFGAYAVAGAEAAPSDVLTYIPLVKGAE